MRVYSKTEEKVANEFEISLTAQNTKIGMFFLQNHNIYAVLHIMSNFGILLKK